MSKYRVNPRLKNILQNPIVAIVIVVLIVAIVIFIGRGRSTDTGYYCQGVYINNVEMSRYTRDEGERLLTAWADSYTEAEYTLTCEAGTWKFSPKDMGAEFNTTEVLAKAWNLGHAGSSKDRSNTQQALRYKPEELWTEFSYNEEKLDAFIEKIAEAVYIEPIDAEIVLTATQPVVVGDSVDGRELNRESLRETLVRVMQYGNDTQVIQLPVEPKEPAVSSDSAGDGLQLIVTYSTTLTTSTTARYGNVRQALSNFNGFEIRPGETVSFNEVVGPRTAIRGYVEGTVYYGGTVTTGMGGGVCQASSTLYGALMKAGIDVIERHHHSLVVSYCEASMDAAVSEDAMDDFVFVNNTEHTMYIYTEVVNKDRATVYVYSGKPEYRIELVSTITQEYIKNPAIEYEKDYSGEYAYYTDQYVLKSEGKLGRKSMLERVYYDWNTGAEVKRETVSEDYYAGERDTYYVGVHDPKTDAIVNN